MKQEPTLKAIKKLLYLIVAMIVLICIALCLYIVPPFIKTDKQSADNRTSSKTETFWHAPDTATLAGETNADEIRYGKELITHTAVYYGPKGKINTTTNGMNCQNCHLDAGTKVFGNNYSAVASTYPKFRERSGTIESVSKRVNDCFERSLNGQALDTNSKEMQAISAYILWLGSNVPKGEKPKGSGLVELKYMNRAADPKKGAKLFTAKCENCHGKHGEGKMNENGSTYEYPPLWGAHSYNIGAGLYRLSRFASYIKTNMPFGATYEKPQLTDEESWDIAAFVNSMRRPLVNISRDWPKLSGKPVDHPFGPYADAFTEKQHKFGPFEPIVAQRKKISLK